MYTSRSRSAASLKRLRSVSWVRTFFSNSCKPWYISHRLSSSSHLCSQVRLIPPLRQNISILPPSSSLESSLLAFVDKAGMGSGTRSGNVAANEGLAPLSTPWDDTSAPSQLASESDSRFLFSVVEVSEGNLTPMSFQIFKNGARLPLLSALLPQILTKIIHHHLCPSVPPFFS